MDIAPQQLVHMTLTYIETLEHEQNRLERALDFEARNDYAYREAKATAWATVSGDNVKQREAFVDATCGKERLARDLATGQAKAAMESVRNKRQSMSAIQTSLNAVLEESQHSRVGPDYDGDLAERVEAERLRGGRGDRPSAIQVERER